MPLVSCDIVQKRLATNRCIKSSKALQDGEAGVSRTEFSGLYSGKPVSAEKDYLIGIAKSLVNDGHKVRDWNDLERTRLKDLFSLLLRNASELGEIFLHSYIYLFWKEIISSNDLTEFEGRCLFLGDGVVRDSDLPSTHRTGYRELMSNLVKNAKVDLVVIDETRGYLYMIDVKRETIDDRAIGQILRYYRAATDLIYKGSRALDLNYVRPVIFQASENVNSIRNLPQYFGDLVFVYSYSIETDGRVTFHNLRKRMLTLKLL